VRTARERPSGSRQAPGQAFRDGGAGDVPDETLAARADQDGAVEVVQTVKPGE